MNEPMDTILNLTTRHRLTWLNKSQWYWYFGLLEEVAELGLALAGLHKNKHLKNTNDINWELCQIASICLNWMKKEHNQ